MIVSQRCDHTSAKEARFLSPLFYSVLVGAYFRYIYSALLMYAVNFYNSDYYCKLPCCSWKHSVQQSHSRRTCVPELLNASAAEVIEELPSLELSVVLEVAYRYLIPTFIFVNLLTNVLNVSILSKLGGRQQQQQQRGQATTYRYLLWLAVTDVLVSLVLIPALVHLDRESLSYAWAFYYAHLEIPILNGFTSASVYIVVGLSLDRFVAVCYPRRYCEVSAPHMATIRIGLSLLVPMLLYVPHAFFQTVICNSEGSGWKYQPAEMAAPTAWFVWTVVVELFHRLVPASLLVFLNGRIIIAFRKVMKRRQGITNSKSDKEDDGKNQQEKRLVYLLVAIVTTFLVTNLPAAVLALIDHAGSEYGSFSHEIFRVVANCLEVAGSSMNFVLYFCFVPDVRQGLLQMLLGVRRGAKGLVNQARTSQGCSSITLDGQPSKGTDVVDV